MKPFLFFLLIVCGSLSAVETTPRKIRLLYNRLDPTSVSEHLALYSLYPESPEGKQALKDALNLLCSPSAKQTLARALPAPLIAKTLSALMNKRPDIDSPELSEKELLIIETLGRDLPNRRLKGYLVQNEEELLKLPSHQIDLARGILLSECGASFETEKKIRSYEALLDLMALQVLARLPKNGSAAQMIREMNNYVFFELGFRFPPQSIYAKEVDRYTFLSSVLEAKTGVCLGVSILYISLAQRLGLTLEMVTPPGHIYVRYKNGPEEINIETTARGIHLDSDEYLSHSTCALKTRNVKEVIGLAHFNQASVFWRAQKYSQAVECYKKTALYVPEDKLTKELMGYSLLLNGQKEEALPLLEEVKDHLPEDAVCKQTVAEDYLAGKADEEAIKVLFMSSEETRDDLLAKKELLQGTLNKFPEFRAAYFTLAGTWLQLHRAQEALETLEKLHALDPEDISTEFYLANLYQERLDFQKAWVHLRNAETIASRQNYAPKSLTELRRSLESAFPEFK